MMLSGNNRNNCLLLVVFIFCLSFSQMVCRLFGYASFNHFSE